MRDANTDFLRAKCSHIEGAWKPAETETTSFKEALSWTKDLNLNRNIFSKLIPKTLVEACKKIEGAAFFNYIVLDCIHLSKH